MVSPSKNVPSEAVKNVKLLGKYSFYLDIKNKQVCKGIEGEIQKFGGKVEVFLSQGVTHVVTDQLSVPQPSPSPAPGGRFGCRRRADAMLERVHTLPTLTHNNVLQQAQLWNIPIWTLPKVKQCLDKIYAITSRKADPNEKILKGAYIKFEASDGKSRAIFKEFVSWPCISFGAVQGACPFMPLETKAERCRGQLNHRMTKKTKPKSKDRDLPPKQSGFCEICRVEYSVLAEHERSPKHISFVSNCSNFLSLDSLISAGTDVEAFLKLNKPMGNNSFERRSLRNIIKLHQDQETSNSDHKKQLEVVVNGGDTPKHMSPRETRHNMTHTQMSPTIPDGRHYLRSKNPAAIETEYITKVSPRECPRREMVVNGSVSPQEGKVNGKMDEKDSRQRLSPLLKGKKPRSIRWRRPSPESNPSVDNQAYYKVVGMSTKLRSSNNFAPQKDQEPELPPPSRPLCNGGPPPGLVVKFRKVRRSELSVLSDEAENFMFPKKDDSDTEDDVETTHSTNKCLSSELNTGSDDHVRCRVKEEVFSGDDGSQDSYGSDTARRKPARRRTTQAENFIKDNKDYYRFEPADTRLRRQSRSQSPQEQKAVRLPEEEDSSKCLKWEDGRLKASPEVERLTYTFEQVPKSEPWYDTFLRQDQGKEKNKSVADFLGIYMKSPILPYEMPHLPLLKPNCCILGQVKKPPEPKSGPSRLYGTRGMKKRKIKVEIPVSPGKKSRKSPREHASTLAILGGLVHRNRSKLSCSEDSKSLPSIAEEDVSSDVPLMPKQKENTIFEAAKQFQQLLSSVYDDIEEYDVPIEHMDAAIKIEKTNSKPNVVDLLQSYEQCETIEKAALEIRDNMQQSACEVQKKRKGYKVKKKNKTGWPNKKKVHPKKEAESVASSRDASSERPETAVEEEMEVVPSSSKVNINNNSDSDDEDDFKSTASSKCESECSESSEDKVDKWSYANRETLQPVVRVTKMDVGRRLRSDGGSRGRRGGRRGSRR